MSWVLAVIVGISAVVGIACAIAIIVAWIQSEIAYRRHFR